MLPKSLDRLFEDRQDFLKQFDFDFALVLTLVFLRSITWGKTQHCQGLFATFELVRYPWGWRRLEIAPLNQAQPLNQPMRLSLIAHVSAADLSRGLDGSI